MKKWGLLLAGLGLSGCVVIVDTADGRMETAMRSAISGHGEAQHAVNQPIHTERGSHHGRLTSVNGGIHLAQGSRADLVRSVNGGVRTEDSARVRELQLVNGRLRGGPNLRVSGPVRLTNGGASLQPGSHVEGSLTSVNARVELNHTRLDGPYLGSNGDLHTGAGSHLQSGIHYRAVAEEDRKRNTPEITIGAGSHVAGTLRFDRPVKLRVHRSAHIGEVIGAEVEWFGTVDPS